MMVLWGASNTLSQIPYFISIHHKSRVIRKTYQNLWFPFIEFTNETYFLDTKPESKVMLLLELLLYYYGHCLITRSLYFFLITSLGILIIIQILCML